MSNKTSEANEQLPRLSDRDHLLDALERPARPVPESIRKAKSCHDEIIAPDNEKSGSGKKQKLKGRVNYYGQPTDSVWPEEDR